jgi:hypothetical protein
MRLAGRTGIWVTVGAQRPGPLELARNRADQARQAAGTRVRV